MTLNVEMADAIAQTAVDFCCAWNITVEDANAKATALHKDIQGRVEMATTAIYRNNATIQEKTFDEVAITLMRMATALMIAKRISPRTASEMAVLAIQSAVNVIREASVMRV